jgi:hypothetical protein
MRFDFDALFGDGYLHFYESVLTDERIRTSHQLSTEKRWLSALRGRRGRPGWTRRAG